MYAKLQQQLQAAQELSFLTSTVDDGDLGAETEPPGLAPVNGLRAVAVNKTDIK